MQDLEAERQRRRAKKGREAAMLRDVSSAESLRMGFSMIRFASRLRERRVDAYESLRKRYLD